MNRLRIGFALLAILGGCAEREPLAPAPTATAPATRKAHSFDGPDSNVYVEPADEAPKFRRVPTPRLRALGFGHRTFPAVDGSTSTQWLADIIAVRAIGISDKEWRIHEQIGGIFDIGDFVREPIKLESGQKIDSEEHLEIARFFNLVRRHSKTPQAYQSLIAGKSDLLLIARGPTDDEVRAAREKGVELVVEPIALDALVFVVNPANPVTGLTIDQLRAIYAGQVARWSHVGVAGAAGELPVRPYVRESGSGSEELMRGLVMNGRPTVDVADYRIPTMRGLINHVATRPDAIGYTVFYYQQFMSDRSQTRLIPINGVLPDRAAIASRRYPLTCEVVMVTRKDLPPDSPAGRLRAWMLSDEGQAVVHESGYVPIR